MRSARDPIGRVSVITPSLNQAPFLLANLESVRAQGSIVREHIVIDGGSDDGSVALLAQRRDPLLRWRSGPDRGQGQAINQGLALCMGEVIGWLNSDDLYRPDAARRAVALLDAHPEVGMVFGHCDKIDAAGRIIGRVDALPVTLEDLLAHHTIPQPSCFIRRAVLQRSGGVDEHLRYAMDYDLWLRLGLLGVRWLAVDEVWACFRLHLGSKSGTEAAQFPTEMERVMERALRSPALPPALRARTAELRRRFHTGVALAAYARLDLGTARSHLLRAARADLRGVDRRLLVCLGKSLLGRRLVRGARAFRAFRRAQARAAAAGSAPASPPAAAPAAPRTAAHSAPPPPPG